MKEMKIILDLGTVERFNAHYKQLHPRSLKAAISTPLHPSLNSWSIMGRMATNALKQKYKEFIIWACEEEGIAHAGIDSCEITLRYYFPTKRRHDSDNYTPKFFFDGLTEAGVITDDDFEHVHATHIYGDHDKENPRTEIVITY